ncbi:MAG: ADP-ribosylglycohydrolase family protein [Dehalococcoidia bacterium]|nr:ADP-ribosylglycohydrolase family protein [Dehalococcoidia bacterium]
MVDAADRRGRGRGVLLGLAAGNLLGLPVEGAWHHDIAATYPDGLTEIDPREANLPMDDDLAQAVDLGEALLGGGDYVREFADRLIAWARGNGRGMGITTGEVIRQLEIGHPLPEPARIIYERRGRIAPNGGVMRCAPVAVARRSDPALLISDSAATCAVTHYAPACQWSCIIINAAIALLLDGVTPDLAALFAAARADGCPDLAAIAHADGIPADVLDTIAAGDAPPGDISWLFCDHRLIGHTLLALQVGLWAAATPLNFEDALVASVSAGGDTDTNAAVAGAVLGTRYGASAIPERWLECIPQRERIEALADGLLAMGVP